MFCLNVRYMMICGTGYLVPYLLNFGILSDDEKLSVILGCNDIKIIRVIAKTCYEILIRRKAFLYN